ncbi:FAD/NAD(P)-binding protein [Pseudalkalibacillus salsuginis]|uniref:FAD/NAD(P)-binding protein n=1 Tax=Pseudalkalibacillus salsuginis TaxID=2910972 RepID=UPI001F256CFF|nr:FAD/NAD(P)-binding protein [Pseudalkalibacillus salsuginis]MCF6410198.1 FAD/NAD(P)-binding protein [Pseudalkalibacillus salsuginis]
MKEWLIIGGGIHGCTIATFLLKNGKVDIHHLQIIDPSPVPMRRWKQLTSRIGMDYLRSPVVHHVDTHPSSLERYAKRLNFDNAFYGYYQKPHLELFNHHCHHTFSEIQLHKAWKIGYVNELEYKGNHWIVRTSDGQSVPSKRVVLAIGVNDQPSYPYWAKELNERHPEKVFHIFDKNLPSMESGSVPVAIIGGGITAAHLINKICDDVPVIQVKRHLNRVHEFDSDPGWMGPKYMRKFYRVENYDERRKIITQARHKGSITQHLFHKQKHLERKGRLMTVTGEVMNCSMDEHSQLLFQFHNGVQLKASHIILATGVEGALPGKGWLSRTIEKHGLKCSKCGFPIVSPELEWGKGLHVAGALAELEIGPVSRNISGARKIAERLAAI